MPTYAAHVCTPSLGEDISEKQPMWCHPAPRQKAVERSRKVSFEHFGGQWPVFCPVVQAKRPKQLQTHLKVTFDDTDEKAEAQGSLWFFETLVENTVQYLRVR